MPDAIQYDLRLVFRRTSRALPSRARDNRRAFGSCSGVLLPAEHRIASCVGALHVELLVLRLHSSPFGRAHLLQPADIAMDAPTHRIRLAQDLLLRSSLTRFTISCAFSFSPPPCVACASRSAPPHSRRPCSRLSQGPVATAFPWPVFVVTSRMSIRDTGWSVRRRSISASSMSSKRALSRATTSDAFLLVEPAHPRVLDAREAPDGQVRAVPIRVAEPAWST